MQTIKLMLNAAIVFAMPVIMPLTLSAGSLTPPGAPAPTMNTLAELYEKLTNTLAEVQMANQKLGTATQQVAVLQRKVDILEARLLADGMYLNIGNMALIPAGEFVMGATTNVGHEYFSGERPQHTVMVSEFLMDKYEVTSNLWISVLSWAGNRGYSFGTGWQSKGADHPVVAVDWYDAIAWCNARSQRDGFTPCYTNANGSIYTNAAINSFTGDCNWLADGYRLPTEAEWEKAARGGAINRRFPWNDANIIQHARANYSASPNNIFYPYDLGPSAGFHPTYNVGNYPYTSPVGAFPANGYGLYDMAGNVFEWCWDWHSSPYYTVSPSTDPRGPASGTNRILRGGSFFSLSFYARVAYRNMGNPIAENGNTGFRCVRKP
jgi:formylglycine-generating enzyme required for sulfatase activity